MFSRHKNSQAQDNLPKQKTNKRSIAYAVHLIGLHSTVAVLCIPVFALLIWLVKNLVIHLFASFGAAFFGLITPVVACVLALCVVIFSNPMHALLSLVGVFLATVLFYVSSGIEFIGLVFLIVYVGAVAILFLFVIMLLNVKSLTSNVPLITHSSQIISMIFGGLLAAHLYNTVAAQLGRVTPQAVLAQSAEELSGLHIDETVYYQVMYRAADVNAIAPLYTEHALLFWITTANLLLSLLGAIVLATSTTEQTIKMVPELSSKAEASVSHDKLVCLSELTLTDTLPYRSLLLTRVRLLSRRTYLYLMLKMRSLPLLFNSVVRRPYFVDSWSQPTPRPIYMPTENGPLLFPKNCSKLQSYSRNACRALTPSQFIGTISDLDAYSYGFLLGSISTLAYLYWTCWSGYKEARGWGLALLFYLVGVFCLLLVISWVKGGTPLPPDTNIAVSSSYPKPLPRELAYLPEFQCYYPNATMIAGHPTPAQIANRWWWCYSGFAAGELLAGIAMHAIVENSNTLVVTYRRNMEELGWACCYRTYIFFGLALLLLWLTRFGGYG